MSTRRTIPVATASKAYDVVVGRNLIPDIGTLVRSICTSPAACIVTDSNVGPLYAERVRDSLEAAGIVVSTVVFPAGERNKNLSTFSEILEAIAQAGLTRDDLIVALGGGVAGDMAGFAAATYLRGCRVVQVPTSLLAMVDSSVGGKTGVDLKAGKNLVGSFFQPEIVIADIDVLTTIDHDLFTDSCGEVIKHGIIRDEALFDRITARPINSDATSADELVDIVARNVEIKRDVVNEDEKEMGLRQILNFGHTIGHAVEAASNFCLGHGSSVAVGMCCIARASAEMGWCKPCVAERIETCVRAYGLPLDTTLDHDTIMDYLSHDKKRHGTGYNIVYPTSIGEVEVRTVSTELMRTLLDAGCGVARSKNDSCGVAGGGNGGPDTIA